MVYPRRTLSPIFMVISRIRRNRPTRQLCKVLYVSPLLYYERLIWRLYTVVFVRSPGTWLVPLTKRLVQQGMAVAHDTFLQLKHQRSYDPTYPFETPAKLLQRLLNSIMSDRTGSKTLIAYFIGNQLFRCYFKVPPLPPP